MSIVFFHRRLQPLLDEAQHVPINDPTSDALHQFRVRDAIEIAREVRIAHLLVSGGKQSMNRFYRLLRPTLFPLGILLRLEIRFNYRFQHEHRRRLNDTVDNRRYPERAQLTVRLWNPDPLDRFRPVGLPLQPVRQFPEPWLHP